MIKTETAGTQKEERGKMITKASKLIREEAIEEFKMAAMQHAEEMHDQFDVDDSPVTAAMWAMIRELEGK
jgi:protein-tyrosine-phosphatase